MPDAIGKRLKRYILEARGTAMMGGGLFLPGDREPGGLHIHCGKKVTRSTQLKTPCYVRLMLDKYFNWLNTRTNITRKKKETRTNKPVCMAA